MSKLSARAVYIGDATCKGCFDLLRPENIHAVFGDKDSAHRYKAYYPRKDDSVTDKEIPVTSLFASDLKQVHEHVATILPSKVWFYLPDKKFILYVEGSNLNCVDYGNFKESESIIVEITGLKNPLTDLNELLRAIKGVESMFGRLEILAKPNRLTTCAACSSTPEKLLMCSRCQVICYCNKECQTTHWKEHKKVCAMIRATMTDETK
jgi:hypothetical protein